MSERNPGIPPIPPAKARKIVCNLLNACTGHTKLNKTGYDFIHLASGFIAHYDLHGFIDYYKEPGSLTDDILRFQSMNQWNNFHPGELNYEYYMSRKVVYNSLCDELLKWNSQ